MVSVAEPIASTSEEKICVKGEGALSRDIKTKNDSPNTEPKATPEVFHHTTDLPLRSAINASAVSSDMSNETTAPSIFSEKERSKSCSPKLNSTNELNSKPVISTPVVESTSYDNSISASRKC